MSDTDDIGTARWFGESWGAPACIPAAQVEVPEGHSCMDCGIPIELGDRGIGVPRWTTGEYHWCHLSCWLRMIGALDEWVDA